MDFGDLDEIEIEVEGKDGRLWPWATWEGVMEIVTLGKENRLSGRLRVKGWREKVKIEHLGQTVNHEFYVMRQDVDRGAQLCVMH